ncbi:MAG: CsbD family protein [Anaerolineae bacterium]
MNKDILKGKWNQFKGQVKQRWGDLTDDDLDKIEGRRDELVGKIQEKYGYTRERAEREVDSFIAETQREPTRR